MLQLTLFGRFSLTDSNGAEIPLKSRKAKALLAYLGQSEGMARSREEIMALLWSDRAETQARGSLRQVLTGLRKDLGDDVLRIDNDTAALDAVSISVAEPTGEEFLAGFHLTDPAFEDWLRDKRLAHEDAPPVSAPPVSALLEKPSIAVLPFENMSKDPDQDYFSDGITQDIITELSRFHDLFIIAPRTSFQFKNKPLSAYEVGKELEAQYIVEGSVRRVGNRVRITAQLTEVESETHLWADRYDRDLEDVFAIQDEVAQEIAAAVPGKIDAVTYERVLKRSGPDLTAYDYVLRGELARDLDFGTSKAVPHFEKAIAIDPMCARAYANLAILHAYNVYAPLNSFKESQHLIRTYCDKALSAEPNDPVIVATLAGAYIMIGDFEACRKCIDRAIRINPNHYRVMSHAAFIKAWFGETEESLEWLDWFNQHDPLSRSVYDEVAFEVYYLAERYDDAIAALAGWSEVSFDIAVELAAACAQAGRMEEATALRERFEAEAPPGHSFKDHQRAIFRTCARERERELWREGYRKAGFPV